jgi:hypothetical protein
VTRRGLPYPHEPQFRALPEHLQARLEVAMTLRAQVASLEHLVKAINLVFTVELPHRTAYAQALEYHVRLMALYFDAAEQDAQGLSAMEKREMDHG